MNDTPLSPLMLAAATAFVLVALVPLVRLLRARQVIHTRTGSCDHCGSRGPLVGVYFLKNTGMLFMRLTSTFEASVCRGCGLRNGLLMTLHTAVLGWWGMLSFIITCFALPMNLLQLWWLLGLQGAEAAAAWGLDAHREYAVNLLATKDRETVVDVLAKQTGASTQSVSAYLDRVATAGSGATFGAPRSGV